MSLNNNLYTENILNDIIIINGDEITDSIDEILTKKLKNKIGYKCTKEGYVDKESIKILERTILLRLLLMKFLLKWIPAAHWAF